ncbi:MAG: di-trans,poly-cis-decaprenylcistransferase [Candidatus Moranbacteria bacterium]|nr:di-trans,poly-cis-decaprenylcistransferase [Candidatus Moranbacteria bacterium]
MDSIPSHIAIIPDGNRRWAKARGLDPWKGHEAGAVNSESLIREARALGIREFSLWGSSVENLEKRPMAEKRELLRVYSEHFRKILHDREVMDEGVHIRFIGRWEERFPDDLKRMLLDISEKTAGNGRYFLNFFLAYSGDDDMIEAFRKASEMSIKPEDVTAETIKSFLSTKDVAPVDLLIRTGGEPHLSAGFLMWEMANAQLLFSGKNYPDFGAVDLSAAVSEYGCRQRRLGS